MRVALLSRQMWDEHQTLSTLTTPFGKELFVAKALELAWHNNDSNVSCIPDASYTCSWTRSNRLSKEAGFDVFTYEVLNVPNRAGIRIHSANYFFQLLGCIALGDALKDINKDSELDVIHSGATVKKFAEVMNHEDFTLIIKRV